MIDYKSLTAQKQADSAFEGRVSKNSVAESATKLSKSAVRTNNKKVPSMYSLEVSLDPEQMQRRKQNNSNREDNAENNDILAQVLNYGEKLGSDSGSDKKSHMKS